MLKDEPHTQMQPAQNSRYRMNNINFKNFDTYCYEDTLRFRKYVAPDKLPKNSIKIKII